MYCWNFNTEKRNNRSGCELFPMIWKKGIKKAIKNLIALYILILFTLEGDRKDFE